MIARELLEKLVCPVHRIPLKEAGTQQANGLKKKLEASQLSPTGSVDWRIEEISGFLITEDERTAYPIIEGIPSLLPNSSIALK